MTSERGNGEKRGRARGGGWRGRGWRGRGSSTRNKWQRTANSRESRQEESSRSSSQEQLRIDTMVESSTCPFKAWTLYLPWKRYSPATEEVKHLRVATEFIARVTAHLSIKELLRKKCFSLDLAHLLDDEKLRESWPNLRVDLEESSELVFGIFGLAKHQLILNEIARKSSDGEATPFPLVQCRIVNFPNETPIQDLRTNYYNKLVTVKGTIVRISQVRPVCKWMAFECSSCLSVHSVHQQYGKFLEPQSCPGHGCRSRRFVPLRSHKQTITVDWQTVRLQEIVQHQSGRVPRTIEVELTEDLVDIAVPGDIVTVTGIVKTLNVAAGSFGPSKEKYMFQIYIRGLSVTNGKMKGVTRVGGGEEASEARERSSCGIEFTAADFSMVQEIYSFESLIFKLIVHSLCPSIYGHELVKAGLILGLFGGATKRQSGKSSLSVRADPHILVVGDPGLGKSQMLNSCASVAPRGVFVTGNTTTSSGLTVTLSRETGNEFALEAGALILADQGCCCIDEFDKMTSQHQALLEAMEQQSISIAKSGIVCSLPARTAVLAAANPVGGHYNKSKTVAENLKLGPALLSRFDLVFILIDKPNEELDSMLSEHVMNLHRQRKSNSMSAISTNSATSSNSNIMDTDSNLPLGQRLKIRPGERIDPIPHELLRKNLAYARRYVTPKLTKGACSVLLDFYVELRQKTRYKESAPITLRQLESLMRLTEARAKVELREEATELDAKDVVAIMRSSMVDVYADCDGAMDFSRSMNGSGTSSRGAAKKFVGALQRHAVSMQKSLFSIEEMKQVMQSSGIKVASVCDFLSSLNTQGFIIKKNAKTYQLLTVDF